MNNKIIAVDFDGTLCENKYPEIGEPKYGVIERLLEEQRAGAKVILWTCRAEKQLADAVYWCALHGLRFDAINENLKETVERFGGDTRKVSATEYWDDRAINPFLSNAEAENIRLKASLEDLKKLLREVAGYIVID